MSQFTVSNPRGMAARFVSYGASLQSWIVPDKHGELDDIVLGFDEESQYASTENQHFGAIAGRVANRTAGGRFTLEGTTYVLALNNGPNHLHGGEDRPLSKVEWHGESFSGDDGEGVSFKYTSPDGEEGYPGNLDVEAKYTLTGNGELRIDLLATTDKPTPVNLCNHAYFNLGGAGAPSVADHEVTIHADRYTPVDETLIPTGELALVAGTPLDFRTPHMIGERVSELDNAPTAGYDHNFVLNDWDGSLRPAATVRHPSSGRVLTVLTTQPGLQFYGGNFLHGQTGKGGRAYPGRSGFCLEAQHFPNSANEPSFPSIILRPGETYHQVCVYRLTVE